MRRFRILAVEILGNGVELPCTLLVESREEIFGTWILLKAEPSVPRDAERLDRIEETLARMGYLEFEKR